MPRGGLYDELVALGVVGSALAFGFAGVEPYLAALVPLQALWVVLRPELVRASAPGLVAAVALERSEWPALAGAGIVAGVALGLAEVRLRARKRQRKAVLDAAAGVTAAVPGAELPLRRGLWLGAVGLALIVGGCVLGRTSGVSGAVGFLLIGFGVTALVSALLGRYRAARLHAAAVPVLRVLVRDDSGARTEVFAADDVDALRPLFRVSLMPLDTGAEEDAGDEGDSDDDDHDDDELLELLDDDRPGPLREAVLYGVPCDGAEVVIVSADEDPDHPPVVERSSGPVRPVAGVREEPRVAVVALAPQAVLRWRAGWLDLLAALLLAQWGVWLGWRAFTEADFPLWELLLVVAVGLMGAARVPVKAGWRITADRDGLWINGLFKTTRVPWDDFRSARYQALELKLRWRGGGSWAVSAPRWKWLERRRELTHPYARLAAELTALAADPALRPTGDSDERERGPALWPWALLLALGWVGALVAARAGL
ncbi:hypothetical protein [Streptomyces sp. NPDC003635]